jgi:hypothetical protein
VERIQESGVRSQNKCEESRARSKATEEEKKKGKEWDKHESFPPLYSDC